MMIGRQFSIFPWYIPKSNLLATENIKRLKSLKQRKAGLPAQTLNFRIVYKLKGALPACLKI